MKVDWKYSMYHFSWPLYIRTGQFRRTDGFPNERHALDVKEGYDREKDVNQGYISHFEFPRQLSTHQNLQFKVTTKDSKKPEENDRLLVRIAFN